MKYSNMTNAEIRKRISELSDILDYAIPSECGSWDAAYAEYSKLTAILDERYRAENQSAFDAYYREHIKGRTWEEIDPEVWDFYSDWHKDMYGFRPRQI